MGKLSFSVLLADTEYYLSSTNFRERNLSPPDFLAATFFPKTLALDSTENNNFHLSENSILKVLNFPMLQRV